ncbi:YwpF family protein [Planococcus shixiaomingii]|uniref:YwpF family protein n=1 Tax=Planococcus shixiaomingii TaxID=3058393 RepID=UPI00261C8F09|nr:YwpF family protein [Planococcus sp. N022]WKA54058.1 YwpF family protein [Planococcus sp. N022]
MKTFKMMSLGIVEDENVIDFPLHDGIIINQENNERSWLLEMLMDLSYRETFEKLKESGEAFDVKVVISYSGNEPAPFQVSIYSVKVIGEHISVLMKGTLKRARRKYAETLLSELLEDGLEGAELLERFEQDMRSRPVLRKDEATS